MADMLRELACLKDASGVPLKNRVIRYAAVDGREDFDTDVEGKLVNPNYTLGDQLFVEPQPHAAPEQVDIDRPIQMTRAEVAIAHSHIGVWRAVAQSEEEYALVLEDDVWFECGFGRVLDSAWREAASHATSSTYFDVLYVSFEEVRHGAPKDMVGDNIFRPRRGLWFLSGYILSRRGAQRLLDLLPCKGPVDLWINHYFQSLNVLSLRRPVIHQRRDLVSTNSYSVLPSLARIGILEGGDASLFHRRPNAYPVFAFGSPGSGLSSLAMALSMLGYRCCSDFSDIPGAELHRLIGRHEGRVFDAYVNVASLVPMVPRLRHIYPEAKFILLGDLEDELEVSLMNALEGADVLRMRDMPVSNWRAVCEHLKVAPPDSPYPSMQEVGLREYIDEPRDEGVADSARSLRFDPSPWVATYRPGWSGIPARTSNPSVPVSRRVLSHDCITGIDLTNWQSRSDTFPGNLGLFRPANVALTSGGDLALSVLEEPMGVRGLSAAAISSRASFLFGRFDATLQAVSARGVVTGFFLHRNSPRQEIDIEFPGNRPDCMLVNVFYNPGSEGAKYDYGYRGTPTLIELGFDASKKFHRYAIEWDPCEIRWFVDGQLVHRRVTWDPTPIPHLPMTLHLNAWPSRSTELAGKLAVRRLPVSAFIRCVSVDAGCSEQANAELHKSER